MSAVSDAGDVEANPDVYLPEYLASRATKADRYGLAVLTVSGRCRCGYSDWRLAPEWRVPAEWGGGFMTDQCPECLGTIEYDDQWEPVHQVVRTYSDLRPAEADSI